MATRVVLDYPHPYVGRRLREAIEGAAGAVLVIIGTVAWLVVIPLSVLALLSARGVSLSASPTSHH